jgi:hypothetical protein
MLALLVGTATLYFHNRSTMLQCVPEPISERNWLVQPRDIRLKPIIRQL